MQRQFLPRDCNIITIVVVVVASIVVAVAVVAVVVAFIVPTRSGYLLLRIVVIPADQYCCFSTVYNISHVIEKAPVLNTQYPMNHPNTSF